MYRFFLFLTLIFRHIYIGLFTTMPMKQHSKTHVNKVLFKKVVDELYFIFKKVTNIFCHKTANAGEGFLFLIYNCRQKN